MENASFSEEYTTVLSGYQVILSKAISTHAISTYEKSIIHKFDSLIVQSDTENYGGGTI